MRPMVNSNERESVMKRLGVVAVLLGVAVGCRPTNAVEVEQEKTAKLEIGSPAPPLSVTEWIKGDPVDIPSGGGQTIYVVEFWATWCGPCRVTIPHLTELAKKYADKGVVFIGISDESADVVKPFVQKMGEQMQYAVAVDKDGVTDAAYRKAFAAPGIPHAFVIDKEGRIVWHGHPMADLDAVLRRLIAGSYDVNVAKAVFASRPLIRQWTTEYHKKTPTTDGEKAEKEALGEKIIAQAAKDPYFLTLFARSILTRKGDSGLALRAAKAAHDADPQDPSALQTYGQALFENGKLVEAADAIRKALVLAADPEMQSELRKTLDTYESAITKQPPSSP